MSICDLVNGIAGMVIQEQRGQLEHSLLNGADEIFKTLGRLARELAWRVPDCDAQTEPEHSARIAFERGYVEASCELSDAAELDKYFANCFPHYLASWELAITKLAALERWTLVGTAFEELAGNLSNLSAAFVAEAVWWALRSGAAAKRSEWLQVLRAPGYGLGGGSGVPITAFLAIARARGWEEVASEPGDIAEQIYAAYDPLGHHEETAPLARLLFRAAALIGRAWGVATRSGWAAAGDVISELQVSTLLEALWNRDTIYSPRFSHGSTAAAVATELSEMCLLLPH